jgi:signal transduction histidine kinase
MGYYFSKNISKPIKVINASALEMARGKYGIKTNIYQRDEIGELSNSFDLLSLKLEHTINQLYDEKTKLSNIITSMNEGIIALDNNFEVINVNQSALNLLSADNLSETSDINDLLSSLNITDQLKSVMESGEKTSVVKKLGDLIINLSISPITGSSNETAGTVILIQDISQKEKLEQMRRDFISNVSHEFRTPLTVIRGNLESIIDGVIDTQDINESCKTILNETSRLERMVKDLLDLSRLESGRFELNLQDIDVNSVVNDTIRGLKQILSNKNISIKKDLYDNIPPVSSDYDRLKQLLIIFLDNSIKFSEKNSEIEIKTSYENNFISLKVTDHGPGIPEGSIQYLGERFYKADISRASNVSGTGLGLSIAKNIVKILNGDFKIESSPGEGTTVTVYLPVIKI